jgi:hypothetical protein
LAHMAAKETTLKEVGEMLTHVVRHMATKDDIARLNTRVDKLDARIETWSPILAAKLIASARS